MNGSKILSLMLVLALSGLAHAQAVPVLNVKNYEAKGDGSTNDTTAIQKAIDSADALNAPCTVYFPRGTYMVSTVTLDSTCTDITLEGEGATIKRVSTANVPSFGTIYMFDCDRCTVKGFDLNGNQNPGDSANTNSLVHINGTQAGGAAEDNRVEACYIHNTWDGLVTASSAAQRGNGITLVGDYVWRTTIENVDIYRVGGDGVRFTCNDTRLLDVHIRDYRNRGFRGYPGGEDDVYPGRRVWIDQCSSTGTLDIYNGGSAILIDPGRVGIQEVYVTNSRFELNRTSVWSNGTLHKAGNAAKFAHIETLFCENCEFKIPFNTYFEAKAVRVEDCVRRAKFSNCRFKPNLFFTETGHGGITAHRPYVENETTDTLPSQAGVAATEIKLATGASSTNDLFIGCTVYITAGTGAGQAREVTDYVGATRLATVNAAWTTPPIATDTYSVGGGDFGTCPTTGTTTTIRLHHATASLIDDYYNGRIITLTGGTGAGQTFAISDYDYTDVAPTNRGAEDTFLVTINGTFIPTPDATTTYTIKGSGKVLFTTSSDKRIIDPINDAADATTSDDAQEVYVRDTGIARYNTTHVVENVTSSSPSDDAGEGFSPRYTQTFFTNVPWTQGTMDVDESTDGTKAFWRTVPDEVYLYNCEFGDYTYAEQCYAWDAFSGTAQGGSTNTIILPGGPKASTAGGVQTGDYDQQPPLRYDLRSNVRQAYLGRTITTTGGTGSGQVKTITNYDGLTGVCTVNSNWTTPPDNTTTFTIDNGGTIAGTAQGGSNSTNSEGVAIGTVTLASTASAVDDAYVGRHITIGSDIRTITDYVGATKVATVQAAWTTAPTSSSGYSIGIPTSKWMFGIENANSRIFEVDSCKFHMFGSNTAIEYAVDNDAYMHRLRLTRNEATWSDTGSQYLLVPENASLVMKRSGKVVCHDNILLNSYTGTPSLVKTTNAVDSGLTGVGSTTTDIVLDGEANAQIYVGKTLTIAGESRLITDWDNATFIATVSPAFSAAPSSGVNYDIADVGYADRATVFATDGEQANRFSSTTIPTLVDNFPVTGLANFGGTATIFLRNDASGTADYYNGCPITLSSGTGSGQVRTISDYEVLSETGLAQAGSAAGTFVLAATANQTADYYNGWTIETTGGTGANQRRTITDYGGADETCTVNTNWSVTPDGTTTYRLLAQRATVGVNWATPPDSTSNYSIAADPTEGAVAWTVGDIVRNSSPNNSAKHSGWAYSNAGWQPYGDKPWFSGLASDTWLTREAHGETYRITGADKAIQLPKLSGTNLAGTRLTFIMDTAGLSTTVGLRIKPFQDTTVGGTSVGEYVILPSVSNSKSDSLCLAGATDRDGDFVTLTAGLDSWYMTASAGTWSKFDEVEP